MSTTPSSLLHGRRIFVTGAGRGIGRAIARICHDEGARVAISSRTRYELEDTAAASNSMWLIVPCDIRQPSQVEAAVQKIVNEWGGIDILINNAGGGQAEKGDARTLESSDLQRLLDMNLVSVHTVTSVVLQNCQPQHIVNISSRAGKIGIPGMAFYVASKFALEGYSATIAEELREHGCQVNTISPGMVDTQSFPKQPGQSGVRTAEAIRDGLLFLLSSDVTGHYLHVDELDSVRAKGLPDHTALKPINEAKFDP